MDSPTTRLGFTKDVSHVMTCQIEKLNKENKRKEEERKKAARKANIRELNKQRIQIRNAQIEFAIDKEKIENSPLREIMETLARKLNSSEGNFALLKARIVGMLRCNQHLFIENNPNFAVEKPYDFHYYTHSKYQIRLYSLDGYNRFDHKIFTIYHLKDTGHFHFQMDLYQFEKSLDLSDDPIQMAEEIIINLMTD